MSKKNAIILILVIFLLILGGLLFFYFSSNKNSMPNSGIEGNTPSTNPFGNNVSNRTSTTTQTGNEYNPTGANKKLATLRQLYAYPVSGSAIIDKGDATKVRFVDRATGNVHEILSNAEETKRITNTTIPKILEAVWSSTGESLILRYSVNNNDQIDNFSGKIKSSTSTSNAFSGEITGKVVYKNADSIIINPSGNKSFGLIKNGDLKGSYGLISSLDGSSNKQIFTSEVSEWLTSWPKDNTIMFVTKPSYKQYGYLFSLNTDSGAFDKVFGGIYGLTALVNKDISKIVYSNTSRSSVRLNFLDTKLGVDKNLQIATLSDKCVWGNKDNTTVYCAVPKYIPNNNYPDAWYQGVVSFSDDIWRINVEQGTTELLYQIGTSENVSLDAYDLKISTGDDFLVFTDKNSLSLWGLTIEQN